MKQVARSLILIVFGSATTSLFAATDGTLGATSQGDFDINLSVGDLIQISRLDDVTLTYTPGSNATNSEDFCVYTNAASGTYNVTATSANAAAGVFRLASGANFIPYALDYETVTLTSGVNSNNGGAGYAANTTSNNCGASDNATVDITVTEADILTQPSGNYSDTVTLLVSPN